MKEDLLDIRADIKAGRYVNEATVSLMRALGFADQAEQVQVLLVD